MLKELIELLKNCNDEILISHLYKIAIAFLHKKQ